MTDDEDAAPALSEDAITARVRRLDSAIVACIDKAREGYALASARVEVAFRVERTGQVSAVRVKAPALLQSHGIYGCVEPLISALRFPRSAAAVVATYPYAVH